MEQKKNLIFLRCCYGYGVSGMAVLVIGAILPSLIEEAGISFLAAGGLLSVMAVGNFCASFLFSVLVPVFGRRFSITLMTAFVPLCLLGLCALPPLPVMYVILFIYGLARGSVTILNNGAVNDIYGDKAAGRLNLLHCSFAVGAFLAPFLTAVLISLGNGWRTVIYILILLTASSSLSYGTMDYNLLNEKAKDLGERESRNELDERSFLKHPEFYCIAFILFFYLGVENCINGWFVTYLQNTGVMGEAYATALVSFTWLVIMAGRLVCACLSRTKKKSSIILMNGVGSGICFFVMISTTSLPIITLSLLGFGFFLAGIYPTCVADAGPLIQGSTLGMSVLTAISAAGGIISPQLVGWAGDRIGIVAAMGILTVNVIAVIFLAAVNTRKKIAGAH